MILYRQINETLWNIVGSIMTDYSTIEALELHRKCAKLLIKAQQSKQVMCVFTHFEKDIFHMTYFIRNIPRDIFHHQ